MTDHAIISALRKAKYNYESTPDRKYYNEGLQRAIDLITPLLELTFRADGVCRADGPIVDSLYKEINRLRALPEPRLTKEVGDLLQQMLAQHVYTWADGVVRWCEVCGPIESEDCLVVQLRDAILASPVESLPSESPKEDLKMTNLAERLEGE
jgi:hypothetical protein